MHQEAQPWSPLVTQPGALCTLIAIFYMHNLVVLIPNTAKLGNYYPIGLLENRSPGVNNLPEVTQWPFELTALIWERTFFPFILS